MCKKKGIRGTLGWLGFAALLFVFMASNTMAADLEISDEKGMQDKPVTFTVTINTAPNDVSSFGFEIDYPEGVLSYTDFQKGSLVEDFDFFDVNEPEDGLLRIGGFDTGGGIAQGATGPVVEVTFDVTGDQDGTLVLQELKDDLKKTWDTKNGTFTFVLDDVLPVAVAEAIPETIDENGGQVTLSGAQSHDDDEYEGGIEAYTWVPAEEYPEIELENPNSVNATFDAPYVDQANKIFEFILRVEDKAGNVGEDTATVNVTNIKDHPPQVKARNGLVKPGDKAIELNGTVEILESEITDTKWELTENETDVNGTIEDPGAFIEELIDVDAVWQVEGTFDNATIGKQLAFKLTATDLRGLSGSAAAKFTVVPITATTFQTQDGDTVAIEAKTKEVNVQANATDQIDDEEIKKEFDLPYGIFNFFVTGMQVNGTETVTFYFPDVEDTDNVWLKIHNATDFEKYENATFYPGNNTVVIMVTDGDGFDQDPAPGNYTDPAALAVSTAQPKDDDDSSGCVLNPQAGFDWSWVGLGLVVLGFFLYRRKTAK